MRLAVVCLLLMVVAATAEYETSASELQPQQTGWVNPNAPVPLPVAGPRTTSTLTLTCHDGAYMTFQLRNKDYQCTRMGNPEYTHVKEMETIFMVEAMALVSQTRVIDVAEERWRTIQFPNCSLFAQYEQARSTLKSAISKLMVVADTGAGSDNCDRSGREGAPIYCFPRSPASEDYSYTSSAFPRNNAGNWMGWRCPGDCYYTQKIYNSWEKPDCFPTLSLEGSPPGMVFFFELVRLARWQRNQPKDARRTALARVCDIQTHLEAVKPKPGGESASNWMEVGDESAENET